MCFAWRRQLGYLTLRFGVLLKLVSQFPFDTKGHSEDARFFQYRGQNSLKEVSVVGVFLRKYSFPILGIFWCIYFSNGGCLSPSTFTNTFHRTSMKRDKDSVDRNEGTRLLLVTFRQSPYFCL
jgi:hypothetical protein